MERRSRPQHRAGRLVLVRPDDPGIRIRHLGRALTLGAQVGEGGTRFAVRAPAADRLWLCLFNGDGERRIAMARDGEDWTLAMPGVGPGARYGYRADGAWAPERGLMFDSAKLLVDPHAIELDRPFRHDPRLAERGVDSAALVPRAVVVGPMPPVTTAPLFRPGGLIYELNVRGFTHAHPDVPPEQRGTLRALTHPAIVAHLQRLDVSAVELMPIVAWIDERHLPPLGLRNAWGYNPVTMMAIDPRLAPGGVAELRDTVAVLRAAGIGTILDVVLNHSGEGDLAGPALSLRGLDNAAYATAPDGSLLNHAGTGNMLDARQPAVRRLWLDALSHFAACGVDGFRFDLAPVLARMPEFDVAAPFFAEIAADPLLATRVMIAEPWDIGPGGYRLGQFPPTWLEWNDRFRDDVRRFWRGDGEAGQLATRIAGSSDVFGPGATRTVNFLAAHDGFALADFVSYAGRHNEANGEGNRDGSADEPRWNNGAEGPSDDPMILARREAEVRAMLATLFASKGSIMLTGGDEFGRTQGGNNNAYAQEALSWLDWAGRDRALEQFVADLADKRHAHPTMGAPAWAEEPVWLTLSGAPMTSADWAGADGFELRVAGLAIRIDRPARSCTVTPI